MTCSKCGEKEPFIRLAGGILECQSCNLSFREGDKVTYVTKHKKEKGIVKSLAKDNNHVFVVYHCDDRWEDFKDFVAEYTHIDDLKEGWLE